MREEFNILINFNISLARIRLELNQHNLEEVPMLDEFFLVKIRLSFYSVL